MDFAMSEAQREIREQILRLCSRFDDAYWLERDRTATFPEAFFAAVAAGNWLGIAMPEAFGGAGLGITEAAIMMQAIAESGAAMSRRLGDPHEHLRPQPGRRVRHGGAEGAHAAAADRRAGARRASA